MKLAYSLKLDYQTIHVQKLIQGGSRLKYKIYNNKLHRRKHKYLIYGPWLWRIFYEFDPKSKGTKNKDKWGSIKLKSFFTAKETDNETEATNRMKDDTCKQHI